MDHGGVTHEWLSIYVSQSQTPSPVHEQVHEQYLYLFL